MFPERESAYREHSKEMKIAYDPQKDVLRILFTNAPIDSSRTALPGVVFDYDDRDSLVALELREASLRVHDPYVVEFAQPYVARRLEEYETRPAS